MSHEENAAKLRSMAIKRGKPRFSKTGRENHQTSGKTFPARFFECCKRLHLQSMWDHYRWRRFFSNFCSPPIRSGSARFVEAYPALIGTDCCV